MHQSTNEPFDSPVSVRKKYGLSTSTSALRLSHNTLEKYHQTFKAFEYPENSGKIGVDKLQKLCTNLGGKLTKDEFQEILANEPKKDGLSFESFCKIMTAKLSEDERESELREVFNAFDQDQDGRISLDELKESVEMILDEKIDDIEDLMGLPKGLPPAQKTITYDQFKQLMNSTKVPK